MTTPAGGGRLVDTTTPAGGGRLVDTTTPGALAGRRFARAALVEALTWFALLAGMLVKYVGPGSERGVQLFGLIHGVVALVYAAIAIHSSRVLAWSDRTLARALLASVPPGGTLIFERWARRTGRMDDTSAQRGAGRVAAPPKGASD